jgi:hypothetical protein
MATAMESETVKAAVRVTCGRIAAGSGRLAAYSAPRSPCAVHIGYSHGPAVDHGRGCHVCQGAGRV